MAPARRNERGAGELLRLPVRHPGGRSPRAFCEECAPADARTTRRQRNRLRRNAAVHHSAGLPPGRQLRPTPRWWLLPVIRLNATAAPAADVGSSRGGHGAGSSSSSTRLTLHHIGAQALHSRVSITSTARTGPV